MTSKQKGLLFISATILSWGVLGIILKVVNKYVDSYTIVWARFSVAYILLSIYLWFKDKNLLKIQAKPPKLAILAASLLGANYIGYMKGVELTTPSNAQIMIQIGPLTLALVGILYFKEKLSKRQILGFVIALTGFSFFYYEQLNVFLSQNAYTVGVLWIVMAALTWALYAIIQKMLVLKYDSRSLNLIIYGLPAIFFTFIADFNLLSELPITMLALLVMLGINTIIAYGCLTESFKYLPANQISILITLNPMLTIFLMEILAFLNVSWLPVENIGTLGFMGAFMVLTGAVFVVARNK